MKQQTEPENHKAKRNLRSILIAPMKFLWYPTWIFPNYGVNAAQHFLSFALLATFGAGIVYIVKWQQYGLRTACDRAKVWLIVAAVTYAIGSALKLLHAIIFHLQYIRKALEELKSRFNDRQQHS